MLTSPMGIVRAGEREHYGKLTNLRKLMKNCEFVRKIQDEVLTRVSMWRGVYQVRINEE